MAAYVSISCLALVGPFALGAAPVAFAQTASPTGPAAAKEHLAKGDQAAKAKDWATALKEYNAAQSAQPSPQALEGIAQASFELKAYGDAYDAYDAYVKTYGAVVPRHKKAAAEARLKEIAAQTGYVSIRVNEEGADVAVDGKSIGATPVAAMLRVGVGPHKVSVTKAGFTPIEQTADVTPNGKAIVTVTLAREAKTGKLVVKEKSGQAVRVLVDGVDVGAAPLDLDVEPGAHEVLVRSSTAASAPQNVDVARGKAIDVELVAVPATAHLEVATSDRQGIVFLDGKPVAEGAFAGDVGVGPHTIAVKREGFETFEKTVTLADKQAAVETVTLRRPEAAAAGAPVTEERSGQGIYGGFGLGALFGIGGTGNEVETHCTELGAVSCGSSLPVGATAFGYLGYSWNPVGLEAFLGGMYDQTTPDARFDGVAHPPANPVAASVPRVEQFAFLRYGGMAAVRARVTLDSPRVRGSLAAGFGVAFKSMVMERHAKTSDGLENRYVDDDAKTYLSPALSIDASVAFRLTPTVALAVGALAWLETAGDDLQAAGSKSQYIGSQAQGVAYPIPTPAYHEASGTQFFLGPYLGMQFGP